jgi:MFS family permease
VMSRMRSFTSSLRTDLRLFKLGYWILVPICVVSFPCITTFNGVMPALLSARWTAEGIPYTTNTVNATMSLLYLVAAVLELLNGMLVDRMHRRGAFMVVALVILATAHLLFALTTVSAGEH